MTVSGRRTLEGTSDQKAALLAELIFGTKFPSSYWAACRDMAYIVAEVGWDNPSRTEERDHNMRLALLAELLHQRVLPKFRGEYVFTLTMRISTEVALRLVELAKQNPRERS